ncbi:MAG: hydrolase [Deltaproteobacteria bacterium HGW-Deltaproteobacteria-11]|nr:MAG: hydrolase [Deltaproteobacteria bacterium HGW-Deltaproteobacteria-11]
MLTCESTVLIIVDIQGNLARVMDDQTFLIENNRKLIKGMHVLGIPILITEQNPLGATIPEIADLLPGVRAITKDTFSCCAEEKFMSAVRAMNRRQILMTGIEAHVCVYQTAMDLLAMGYEVHLAADAVSSRTARNREIGIRKLITAGAVLTSAEMVLFELLKTAADPKAKDIFRIIK